MNNDKFNIILPISSIEYQNYLNKRSYIRIPMALWRHCGGTVAALRRHCGGILAALSAAWKFAIFFSTLFMV
jgi:hypothetical protein